MQGIAAKGRGQVDHGEEKAGNMLDHMVTCEVEKTRVSLAEEGVECRVPQLHQGWQVGSGV